MGNLERAGVPRSAAMKMVGHKTQSIYSRYAIADEGMLKDAALKLARLHDADESWRRSVDSIKFERTRKVVEKKARKWSSIETAESGSCLISAG